MSRIGVKPIQIPQNVEVKIESKSKLGGQKITVKGPLGELSQDLRKEISVRVEKGQVLLKRESESKIAKSLFGLYRTLISNMIEGVQNYFIKHLELVGIGYRAELKGDELSMKAGATHPFILKTPEGISFEVKDKVNITVKGIDKQKVGQIASFIRSLSKPEPYKGKGIRYKGEYVRRKPGKAAKAAEGTE